jgi:hypothetical protein
VNFNGFRHAVPGEQDGFFQFSGIRENKKLAHHPFVVFHNDHVAICDSARTLMEASPGLGRDSPVGRQWRSDFFHFKVADLIAHVALIPAKEYQSSS